ncbi:MAG: hypothetical protein KDA77_21610, partial [Planctomycetaceae bacterium]|nr:hypothetical protein [Planctomycetaceae bacterium]
PEINMPGLEQPAPTSQGTRSEIMQSHIRILMSRDLLEKVVLSLGVKNIYPSTVASADSEDEAIQKAIDSMVGGDLEVKPSGESNLIEIYVHNENPEMAERIVSRLMDMFVVRQAEIYDTEQTSFLDKQIEQMKYKLEESRNKLLSFKEPAAISAIDDEMSRLLR